MKYAISLLVIVVSILALLTQPQKTSAISDNAVIYQVQTGGAGSGTATQELILIYNQSELPIEVTNWCIEYRSASFNLGFSECLEPLEQNVQIWLEPKGMISFATSEFVALNSDFVPDLLIKGGMNSSSGHLILIDKSSNIIDKVGWGGAINPEGFSASAHSSGQLLSRNIKSAEIDTDVNLIDFVSATIHEIIVSGLYEIEVEVDVCINIEGLQLIFPDGYLANDDGECFEDFCPNLDGLQIEVPMGYEKPFGLEFCEEIPLENRVIFITELLPNPPSYDTDAEFIELYNPNNETISLIGYKIQVGPSYTKEYVFKDGVILPFEYLVFNDGITGITLPNSNGVKLRLVAPAGNVVSQSEIYSNAGDDVSWALVDDQWIFTNQITPDGPNKPYLEPVVNEVLSSTTVYAPCPEGKFRNPETNRCKNIETAISQLTPCGEDEYRNPQTNRCRKLSSSSASLKPCDEGQERNPETNRCRKVSTLGVTSKDDLPTITDISAESTNGEINWSLISFAVFGTFGYMLYEWRSELGQVLVKVK